MEDPSQCPECQSESIYPQRNFWICAECSHEWSAVAASAASTTLDSTIRDANGNALAEGDSVSVIKDLKVKGSSSVVKVGTKVKNIRLVPDADDGHNIDCRIEGFGAMKLKSEFVKKV